MCAKSDIRIPPELIRQFTSVGNRQSGPVAAEAIVTAILNYFKAEITVYGASLDEELFRFGHGNKHGIIGVHIHLRETVWNRKDNSVIERDTEKAIAFVAQKDFNMYLGILLQALATGHYRAGF